MLLIHGHKSCHHTQIPADIVLPQVGKNKLEVKAAVHWNPTARAAWWAAIILAIEDENLELVIIDPLQQRAIHDHASTATDRIVMYEGQMGDIQLVLDGRE